MTLAVRIAYESLVPRRPKGGKAATGLAALRSAKRVRPFSVDRLADWAARWKSETTPSIRDWCIYTGCEIWEARAVLAAAQRAGVIQPVTEGPRGWEIRLTRKGYARARAVAEAQAVYRSKALSAVD